MFPPIRRTNRHGERGIAAALPRSPCRFVLLIFGLAFHWNTLLLYVRKIKCWASECEYRQSTFTCHRNTFPTAAEERLPQLPRPHGHLNNKQTIWSSARVRSLRVGNITRNGPPDRPTAHRLWLHPLTKLESKSILISYLSFLLNLCKLISVLHQIWMCKFLFSFPWKKKSVINHHFLEHQLQCWSLML